MLAILAMGFLIGMRHALDPDHVITVATLSCGRLERPRLILHGLVWGAGHAATLFGLAAIALVLGRALSPAVIQALQLAVGLVLLALGTSTLWSVRSLVWSGARGQREPTALRPRALWRTLLVGLAQGMAGSAALLLLALTRVSDPWLALAYVLLFGVGAIAGMGLLAALVALPLRRAATLHGRLLPLIAMGAGALTVCLGIATLLGTRHA